RRSESLLLASGPGRIGAARATLFFNRHAFAGERSDPGPPPMQGWCPRRSGDGVQFGSIGTAQSCTRVPSGSSRETAVVALGDVIEGLGIAVELRVDVA